MSVIGERDGLAIEIGSMLSALTDDHEFIEEYWEGDPPSFTLEDVQEPEETDNIMFVITSTGNRFKVTVEVAE